MVQLPAAQRAFQLGQGITFENHLNRKTEEPGREELVDKRSIRADLNCVYLQEKTDQRLLYVIKYKAGHKLTGAFI